MTDLSESNNCTNLIIITNHLEKELKLVLVKDLEIETVA